MFDRIQRTCILIMLSVPAFLIIISIFTLLFFSVIMAVVWMVFDKIHERVMGRIRQHREQRLHEKIVRMFDRPRR